MDPISLIATAIIAGTLLGLKDTASQIVRDSYSGLKKLLTAKLDAASKEIDASTPRLEIEDWLRTSGAEAHRELAEKAEELLRHISEDIRIDPPNAKDFLANAGLASLLDDNTRGTFSDSIQTYFATIDREIERLTTEQYRILRLLRYVNRVRVSGCAGSGKTLVAVEKSIRLSMVGLRTLFICHSPLLASYVRNLTGDSGVDVRSFSSWVFSLAQHEQPTILEQWTNYEEPYPETLEAARIQALSEANKYYAIVVDEGQDFRPEWWAVIEAALRDRNKSILYIFHDDAQSLLPFRATYPIESPIIDLSRNCRNAGNIYDVLRTMYPQAPEAELNLSGKGIVEGYSCRKNGRRSAVSQAVRRVAELRLSHRAVVLLAGGATIETIGFRGDQFPVTGRGLWQEAVRRYLTTISNYGHPGLTLKTQDAHKQVRELLLSLSKSILPTRRDSALVNRCAKLFQVDPDTRRRIQSTPAYSSPYWRKGRDGSLYFSRPSSSPIWAAEIILFLASDGWIRTLPQPDMVGLRAYYDPPTWNSIPIYDVASFKGLEADAVILLIQGYSAVLQQSVYVGLSRARHAVVVIGDSARSISQLCPTIKIEEATD